MNQHACGWTRRHGDDRVARVPLFSTATTFFLLALACIASPLHAQSLPAGWTGANIGNAPLQGTASANGSVYSIDGSAGDIWRSADQFFYMYRSVSGDVDIVARVTSVENTNEWAKAGVMVRASLAAGAAHTSIVATPAMGLSFLYRPATNQASLSVGAGAGAAPVWVKLERRGTAITAFRSPNGVTWTMVGSQTLTLPATFYVGLAVSSHNTSQLATATYDNVTVRAGAGTPTPPTVSLTAPANGATYNAPATVNLTANASDSDDGIAQVEFFAGSTLIGTDSTSPYAATWSNVPAGTYSLTAVARNNAGATTTSAARSITVGSAPDTTPPTVAITAPSNGATVQNTVTVSANASDNSSVASVTFKVDGNAIGAADTSAPYSVSWDTTTVTSASHVLTAEATDAAGNRRTSAQVNVTVSNSAPPPPPPPSGWTSADIGNPAQAGSTTTNGGSYSIASASSDIWGTADQFRFMYRAISGDVDIVARLSAFQNANEWAKAGVMVRRDLTAGSVYAAMLVTPTHGAGFQRRTTAGQASTVTQAGTGGAPVWVKLQRRGSTLTALRSADGVTWTTSGTQTLTLADPVYVGLAFASHNTAQLATAVFDSVTTDGSTPPPPPTDTTPPTVSMTSPTNGTSVTGTVTVSANAADNVGVASVTFRVDGSVIGSPDTTAPYSVNWNSSAAAPGTHVLNAEAVDAAGNRTTSGNVTVTVPAPQNQPPTASLTAPANGATYTAPASITINANAGDTDGTISRVDFYAGTTMVGSDTSSPYSFTWSGVAAGTYSITAVARDNGGATATSAARSVTVNGGPAPTRAIFNPSTSHDTGVTSYRLDIFTNGADPNTATPVQTQNLGKPQVVNGECSVDIAATIQSLPNGTYIATVTAIGPGGQARSAPSAAFTR